MNFKLNCFDTTRKNSLVFSRIYNNENAAYVHAKRDFKLKSKQLGTKLNLPNIKLWDELGNTKSVDSGMIYSYSIEIINLVD